MLPGAIGGAALREHQLAHPELRTIPTIIVSAEPQDLLAGPNALAASGVDGWVSKPYRFDELLAIVKRHVTPEASALLTD